MAFKEWAGVCDALGSGRQSLILRKGGVSEGAEGFRPDHPAFWLYPTHVHQAEQGLRTPSKAHQVEINPDTVAIEFLAVVEWVGRVESVERLATLAEFHDWTESTILGRFHYRAPGLWALAVRVYRRAEPSPIAVTPAQLGCKTWVPLELPPTTDGLVAVLDPGESSRRIDRIRSTVGAAG